MDQYEFTNNWFGDLPQKVWDSLVPHVNPQKILEIGSYEGASATYLIDMLAPDHDIELHCIDTWEGSQEHQENGEHQADMRLVETRFDSNMKLAIANAKSKVDFFKYKGSSDSCLPRMLSEGKKNYFDFVYIDGSHQAPDVLFDAVVAFKLLAVDGVIAFDDYLWSEETLSYGRDPLRCLKPAIDAFVNLNFRKVKVLLAPLYQLYVQKVAD